MSEQTGYQQWLHVVPSGGSVLQELQDGEWIVVCYAPTEPPPPPPPPNTAGVKEGRIQDQHYKLDWEFVDGELQVNDLDITLSKDGEAG